VAIPGAVLVARRQADQRSRCQRLCPGWVSAASSRAVSLRVSGIWPADITAWIRLLGFCDDPGLREAGPDTLRYRVWHIPARLAPITPARAP